MDLRQLQYLVAVADEGGFRRAARHLCIAQPPLSIAIQRLERELGVALLDRSTRGVVPTAAGIEMVSRAREILAQVESARRSFTGRHTRDELPTIRVGVIAGPLSAGELTGPIFKAVGRALPQFRIATRELSFANQVDPILNGEVDVAIVRPPLGNPDIEVIPIAEEPRCLLVSPLHELADAGELSVADVLGQRMLPLDAPNEWASFWQLDDIRGHPLIYPETAPVGSVNAVHLALLTTSAAITVSESTTRLARSTSVNAIRLIDATPSVTAVAYRRGQDRDDVRLFVETAIAAAAEHMHLLPGGRVPTGATRG
jgi:DNA-binding transcriptional LysR family regulator